MRFKKEGEKKGRAKERSEGEWCEWRGKGECTAEDVVCFRTEKKEGEEEYNASARHEGRGI